jgi:Ca2+-binding RTX toxin-like protein
MLLPDLTPWANQSRGFVYDWTIQGNDLRLTTAIANTGAGPLELRGGAVHGDAQDVAQRIFNADGSFTDVPAGTFVYHPEHGHIHFEDFAAFRLRAVLPGGGVGDVVAAGAKVSFCLLDVERHDTSGPNAQHYLSCGQMQGISSGWADVYSRGLPGQSIDITNVPDGKYWLEVEADPLNRIVESDETNNFVRIEIDLKRPVGSNPIPPDTFEANDSFATASILAPPEDHTYAGLTLHASQNDDYYRVTASATGALWFDLAFSHAQGDVDMAVYDAARTLVGRSDSDTNAEHVRVNAVAGDYYYVRVFGFEGATNPNYTFSVDQFDSGNQAPADIRLSSDTVQEFRANGTVVGTLSTTDTGGGNFPTYTLLNDAGGRFVLAGDQIKVANGLLLDFEQTQAHTITLRSTDRGGLHIDKSLVIHVANVDPEVVTGDGAANVIVGGAFNDRLSGGAGNDVLKGGAGSDTLAGNVGDDFFVGGAGRDFLYGGDGRDIFYYGAVNESAAGSNNRDLVYDFQHGIDKFDISKIDANGARAGDTFTFIGNAQFSGISGQLRFGYYNPAGTANDRTSIAGDTNGDRVADFQIELVGLKTISAIDFVL